MTTSLVDIMKNNEEINVQFTLVVIMEHEFMHFNVLKKYNAVSK